MTNHLLAHALDYAQQGYEVFPCSANKIPLTEHGMKDASSDPDTVTKWWTEHPSALIGCRIPADQVVLDVDPKNSGLATWKQLKAEHGELPVTRTHASGRNDGGGHIWYQRPAGKLTIKPLNQWARDHGTGQAVGNHSWVSGIDLLHHGHRYTILPPSPHPATGKPYRWLKDRGPECAVVTMPAWLVALVTEPAADPAWTRPALSVVKSDWSDSIADWFTETTSWADLLVPEGWTVAAGDGEGDGSRWRHPNASAQWSATIRHGCLFVYSTSTDFEPTGDGDPNGYTRFRAWATLAYRGDLQRAALAARELRDGPQSAWALSSGVGGGDGDGGPSGAVRGASGATTTSDRETEFTAASTFTMRRVRWLWDGYIPMHELTLLAGREGVGKSTFAYDLAADITRGKARGELQGQPRGVVVAAGEDSWEHTIVPRLVAAGADLARIYRVNVKVAEDQRSPLTLPVDGADLAKKCRDHNVALVLLDPLVSRLDKKLDTHKNAEVRTALEPIVELAAEHQITIAGLIHLNKSGGDPLTRIMASRAFVEVARCVLFFMHSPQDDGSRLLGQTKNNLGPYAPTLRFTIEDRVVGTDPEDGEPINTGKLVWLGETDISVEDALEDAERSSEERTEVAEAGEWLVEFLTSRGGAEDVGPIKSESGKMGWNFKTLQRAKKQLAIPHEYSGFPKKTYWRLPDAALISSNEDKSENRVLVEQPPLPPTRTRSDSPPQRGQASGDLSSLGPKDVTRENVEDRQARQRGHLSGEPPLVLVGSSRGFVLVDKEDSVLVGEALVDASKSNEDKVVTPRADVLVEHPQLQESDDPDDLPDPNELF